VVLVSPIVLRNVFAQSTGGGSADISISISTPPPQLYLSAAGDQLDVHWHWDFISLGYYPPPITEVRVEISTDTLNYGNLQVLDADDFVAIYPGLPDGTYTAQVTIVDGNDYDYIVGPITINVGGITTGGGGRPRLPDDVTNVTLTGVAYPGPSTVVIFTYGGGFETTVSPNAVGTFSYQTDALPVGVGSFSFSAKDPNDVLSAPITFDYDLPANVPVFIDGIYLPPTIGLSSSVVIVGDLMTVSGYGFANGSISLDVEGPNSRAYLLQVNSSGFWTVALNTTDLGPGTYDITAQSTGSGGAYVSPLSEVLVFELVLPQSAAPFCGDGVIESPEQCDDSNQQSGDGCSALCVVEGFLPESSILQPNPSIFNAESVDLGYFATSQNGDIDVVEVYYSRNGNPYVVYPASFVNGVIELTGLPDGDYEAYSIARDETGAIEAAPFIADATFVIDRVVELNVLAYPEKRSPAQGNWAVPSRLTVYAPGNTTPDYTYDFVTDSQGRFDQDASLVALGDYNFLLKGLSHLSKRLDNLPFREADLLLDFTQQGAFFLLAGDVHVSKDDYVNGLDLSATVIRLYSGFLDADLNRDGYVNGMDLSIIVGNLYKRGDGA
jgi:cysteine-rich repeat protein